MSQLAHKQTQSLESKKAQRKAELERKSSKK